MMALPSESGVRAAPRCQRQRDRCGATPRAGHHYAAPCNTATHSFLDESPTPDPLRKQPVIWEFWELFWRGPIGEFLGDAGDQASAKRNLLLIGTAAFAAVAVWLGGYWLTKGRFIESTDDAYVGGEVTALSPKVAGFIEVVAVEDNQFVKTGELLLKLDDRDYRAKLARAEASVAAQRAGLVNLEANRRLQQAMIEEATADIAATSAELVRAKYDVDRYRTLSNDRFASRQRFEQADADHEKAHAAQRRATAARDAAELRLDVIETQKQQVQAALDQAMAERDLARLNVSYTEIRAPIDGMVGNRSARAGAYATAGAQLLSIVPAHGLWVDANFKEGQLTRMKEGQPAEVFADAMPGVRIHGRVAGFAPATGAQFSVIPPENATGNFTKIVQRVPVRIVFDEDAAELGRLRPGLSVVVYADTRQATGAREARP
jgi:membrane fusion protein, multidrug efflux system